MFRCNFKLSRQQTLAGLLTASTKSWHIWHGCSCQAPARNTAGRDSNSSGQSTREAALPSIRLSRGRSESSDSNKQFQMGSTSLSYTALTSHTSLPTCLPVYTTTEHQACSPGTEMSLMCIGSTDRHTERSLSSPSLAVRCGSFIFSMKILRKSMKTQIWEQSLNF